MPLAALIAQSVNVVETPPSEPPPAVVGGGGGTLVRRRWVARPIQQPPPRPVQIRVRISVTYRWTAQVVATRARARVRSGGARLGVEARAVTVHVAEQRAVARMEMKNVKQTISPAALNRQAWEQRELNELAVALAALE